MQVQTISMHSYIAIQLKQHSVCLTHTHTHTHTIHTMIYVSLEQCESYRHDDMGTDGLPHADIEGCSFTQVASLAALSLMLYAHSLRTLHDNVSYY